MAMAMERHTKTAPEVSARADDCFVSTLDVCEVQDRDFTSHLSADERAKYASLPGERRKSEWLAGRLAAKHLFLNRLEVSGETRSQTWRPALSKLSAESLGVYSTWMYRKIEVLAFDGKPGLVWCGKDRPERISLSHTGGLSCACIASGTPTAIDVETSMRRHEAFYRSTFSEVERYWATRGAEGELSGANWYFTLLWTLKESALKLGWTASLWNLPGIEFDGLPGLNHLEPLRRSRHMGDAFVVFTASVKKDGREMQVQAAVAGTRNYVLTVMNPLIGAVN